MADPESVPRRGIAERQRKLQGHAALAPRARVGSPAAAVSAASPGAAAGADGASPRSSDVRQAAIAAAARRRTPGSGKKSAAAAQVGSGEALGLLSLALSGDPSPPIVSDHAHRSGGFGRKPSTKAAAHVSAPAPLPVPRKTPATGGGGAGRVAQVAVSDNDGDASSTSTEAAAPAWVKLTEMVSARVGGRPLFATDEWFATCENMLKTSEPVFIPDKFTEYGKWMDGWETRRKRTPGHDWCVLELGLPGVISGIHVNTAHFTGNYSPQVSVQAAWLDEPPRDLIASRGGGGVMGTCATREQWAAVNELETDKWETIVPMTKLAPGYANTRHSYFTVTSSRPFTHLRVNMHPDGGIARLAVHGAVRRDWSKVSPAKELDLIAAENGGTAVSWSDEHYGVPSNIIVRRRGVNMGDGWETARKLARPPAYEADAAGNLILPGLSDWAVFALGHAGRINEVEVDTQHFKGNFPESCTVEAALIPRTTDLTDGGASAGVEWVTIVARDEAKLTASASHLYDVGGEGPFSHIKLTIYPDGGVMRLRVRGTIDREAEASVAAGGGAASSRVFA